MPKLSLALLLWFCRTAEAGGSGRQLRGTSGAEAADASADGWAGNASAAEVELSRSAWTPVRIGWAGSQPADFGFPGGSGEATCLDVASSTRDWAMPELQVYRCNGKDGQLFLVESGSSAPQIKWAANPNKCLDVINGRQSPQEKRHEVKLHDCHPEGHADRINQAFSVQFLDSGYASHIVWLGNGQNQCLDNWDGVVNTPSTHASKIVTWPCHKTSEGSAGINQLWFEATSSPATTTPSPAPDCDSIFVPDVCVNTPGCSWCGRPPEACFVEATDACSN